MANILKKGLSYFPHECSGEFSEGLEYIISRYGPEGYYVYFRLLEKIYSGDGYYMRADEKSLVLFSSRIKIKLPRTKSILEVCLNEGLFNKSKYDNYEILTSSGIQKRYIQATEKRMSIRLLEEYLLLPIGDINRKNVVIIPIDDGVNLQSKEYETIQNEIESKKAKIYQQFILRYNDFIQLLNGVPPKIDESQIKAANDLINYFRIIYESKVKTGEESPGLEEQKVLEYWNLILSNWDSLDLFYKKKTKLSDINHNIQNIITIFKNERDKRNNSASELAATVHKYFGK